MTPSVPLEGKNNLNILLVTTIILAVAVFAVADDENSELRTQNLEAELAQLEGGWDMREGSQELGIGVRGKGFNKIFELGNGGDEK